ncbi:MAG: DUF427 domain-containing protein [Acidimicrobiales bacterium]|nr:DUF427 domain-containing protein [Acidimicrobiales bacterium]
MSLTSGRGPLSRNPAGRFTAPVPDDVAYVEPVRRRVRAVLADRIVVDTEAALLVHRAGGPPTYAFPPADVDVAALGAAVTPHPDADGFVAVAWAAPDHWYEEEDEVFLHPRNPYHRIECLRTTRHLRVAVGDTVLVDAPATIALYETALEPKLYVDKALVRTDLLVPSTTTTLCPSKGTATWWSAVVDGVTHPDVAWSYEDPLPESLPIAGLLCFDPTDPALSIDADLPPGPA